MWVLWYVMTVPATICNYYNIFIPHKIAKNNSNREQEIGNIYNYTWIAVDEKN